MKHVQCVHGYGHHVGMHACDPYNHGEECPHARAMRLSEPLEGVAGTVTPYDPFYAPEGYVEPYSVPIRLERMPHDHIGQVDNGVAGCRACETIDPWHMTEQYGDIAYRQMRQWQ